MSFCGLEHLHVRAFHESVMWRVPDTERSASLEADLHKHSVKMFGFIVAAPFYIHTRACQITAAWPLPCLNAALLEPLGTEGNIITCIRAPLHLTAPYGFQLVLRSSFLLQFRLCPLVHHRPFFEYQRTPPPNSSESAICQLQFCASDLPFSASTHAPELRPFSL